MSGNSDDTGCLVFMLFVLTLAVIVGAIRIEGKLIHIYNAIAPETSRDVRTQGE